MILTQMSSEHSEQYNFKIHSHTSTNHHTPGFVRTKARIDEYWKKCNDVTASNKDNKTKKKKAKNHPFPHIPRMPDPHGDMPDAIRDHPLWSYIEHGPNGNGANNNIAVAEDENKVSHGKVVIDIDDTDGSSSSSTDEEECVVVDPADVVGVYENDTHMFYSIAPVDPSKQNRDMGINEDDDGQYNEKKDDDASCSKDAEMEVLNDESSNGTLSTISAENGGLFEEMVEEHTTVDNRKVFETLREPTLFSAEDLQKDGDNANEGNNKKRKKKNAKKKIVYLTEEQTKEKIEKATGTKIVVGSLEWTVGLSCSIGTPGILDKQSSIPPQPPNKTTDNFDTNRPDFMGAKGIKFLEPGFDQAEYFNVFLPGDPDEHVQLINKYITEHNTRGRRTRGSFQKVKALTVPEYWCFIGVMLLGSVSQGEGRVLWDRRADSLVPQPIIQRFMIKCHFKELRPFVTYAMSDPKKEGLDPW